MGDFWGWVGEGECFSLKFLGERRTQVWGSASGQGQDKCGAFSGVFLAQTSDSVVTCQGPRLSVLSQRLTRPSWPPRVPLEQGLGARECRVTRALGGPQPDGHAITQLGL